MATMNKVILAGNLTRDPELRYSPKGKACGRIALAINRTWVTETNEKREEVTFVDVDVFGRPAENCAKFLKRGRPALVEGRLRLDQWDDKQTGEKRQRLVVVAEQVQFLGDKGAAAEDVQPGDRQATAAGSSYHQEAKQPF